MRLRFIFPFILAGIFFTHTYARIEVDPRNPNYFFTQEQLDFLLKQSRAYLRAVDPKILAEPKAPIFEAIPNWRSTNDVLVNDALIKNVEIAGKKSAEKYKDELADLEAKRLEANRKAKEKGIRIVNTGILKKGRELCKKLRDLNEQSSLCR